MEGNNSFLQEDVNYDDLINGTGWPASTDQYAYQPPPQPTQGSYAPSYSNQPSFEHFDLQQQHAYPSSTYVNSPYSTQSQYQHARPSDVFGPNSYNLDPALQTSSGYPVDSAFSFGHHGDHSTVSPQTLQYQMAASQPSVSRSISDTFQEPANDYNRQPQEPVYFNNASSVHTQNLGNSIPYPGPSGVSPHAGQNSISRSTGGQENALSTAPLPKALPVAVKPALRITHPELHAANNPSSRPRFPYAPFLSWEDVPIQVAPGLKNTLPKYHPRKSRSGKELVPGLDISRVSAPARVSTKSKKIKSARDPRIVVSKYKGTSQGPRVVNDKVAILRADGTSFIKSPSATTETSSSEDESSSEEESEYEEDEDMPIKDISEVRSATRPTDPSAAAGWDATGIIWKDPNSNPNADIVKGAIEDYGNFVSTLRVQLKTNSTQTEAAASRPADVDRLKKARQILLESLYQTINAALTLGYPAIVENLGSHQKLVNGLTTTLIECIKTEDFLGKLPKAVFSLLAKFQNMSDLLLKKLKFDSITKRWIKKGDDEIKKNIASILANTTEAKEKAASVKKESQGVDDTKTLREKIEQSKQRPTNSVTASSSTTKRPHDGDSVSSQPSKKIASTSAGIASTLKPVKRTTNLLANNLLGISSKPANRPIPKKREPSPPTESKLGALLAQIAEPVKPPKAPEAKSLPPETPEEKKIRERKESRRHLRVKFKEGTELEEVRLFKHEQAEDEGRQDNELKDYGDERSEGMMHKQRVSESIDSAMEGDDDDYDPETVTFEEKPYPSLVEIDFSDLEKSTTFGPIYATRGGERVVITPEQQAQERRESLELMVVYTDPKDIPPTPKEPPQGDMGSVAPEKELKAPNESWIVQRLQEAQHYGPQYASQLLQQRRSASAQQNPNSGPQHPTPQLSNSKVTSSISSTQNPANIAAWENLQRIVESLRGKPFPPTEPPSWMINPDQKGEWWDGYNRDNAEKVKLQVDAQIAQLRATHLPPPPPPPQNQVQPLMHPMIANPFPPPAASMVPQVPDMNQQLQAYLASLQGGSSHAPAQQYDYNGWSSNTQEREYGDYGQNRWDGERESENTRPKKKQGYKGNGKDRGFDMKQYDSGPSFGGDGLFDENGEYKGKKKPCRFWQEGKCAKGAKCTYLHDER